MIFNRFEHKSLHVFNITLAFTLLTRTEWSIYLHSPVIWNLVTAACYAVPALLLLLSPSSVGLFVLMLCGQVIDALYNYPQIPNHWMLTFITSTVLLISFAYARFKQISFEQFFLFFRGRAYVGLGIFYLFTAFWKTNRDFLNPEHSCAFGRFVDHFARFYAFPEVPWLQLLVVFSAIAFEYVFAVMLFFRKTRGFAALMLFGFHVLLAVDKSGNYQNFSWTMVTHLLLLSVLRDNSSVLRLIAQRHIRVGLVTGSLLVFALVFVHPGVWSFVRWAWSLTILIALFVLVLRSQISTQPTPIFTMPTSRLAFSAVLFAGLIFFNGITPILGIKNRSSWQMYSNLRIEAGFSNHFLLPPSLDLFGFQRDTAQIIKTSDPYLQREYVQTKSLITWHDLRTYVAYFPKTKMSWIREGQTFHSSHAGEEPTLPAPPWWLQKLVWFRPIGPQTAQQCAW